MTKIQPLLTWRSAVCESKLRPATRHVALTLSLYMSERGDSAYPGAKRLAHDTGLSENNVRIHLQILVDEGWLHLVEKGGLAGEKRRANVYASRIPEPPLPLDPPSTMTRNPASPVILDTSTPHPDDTRPPIEDGSISSLELSKNSLSAEDSRRVNEALNLIAERDVAEAKKHRKIDSDRGYFVTCRNSRMEDGTLGELNVLAGANPDWTAEELADAFTFGEPAEVRDPDCSHCGNSRWVVARAGGVVRCTVCWPEIEARRTA